MRPYYEISELLERGEDDIKWERNPMVITYYDVKL